MQCVAGLFHHLFGREARLRAGLDFLNAPPDFLCPSGFEFGIGVILQALYNSFRQPDARASRELLNFLFQNAKRHGPQ